MNLGERLMWAKAQKEKRSKRPVSWAEMARACGVSTAAVAQWKKNANGIEGQYARPLAVFLGVNSIWLETGEGLPEDLYLNPHQVELMLADQLATLVKLFADAAPRQREQILDFALAVSATDAQQRGPSPVPLHRGNGD